METRKKSPIRAGNDENASRPSEIEVLKSTVTGLQATVIELQSLVIDLLRRERTGIECPPVAAQDTAETKGTTVPLPAGTRVADSGLTPFCFEGKDIRIIRDRDEIWVVAKDVAEALGYTWKTNLIYHVPEEWRGTKRISTLGGRQDIAVLSEQGLYFFVARSDKPKAIPFQKWIAGEVLPSLRRTGRYEVPARPSVRSASEPVADPFRDCGVHDAEFLAFLAITRGRMGRDGDDQVSIHTAKVLRWLWHRCLDEARWYPASRKSIGRDLALWHTTVLRCLRRLESWGFVEQRLAGAHARECRLIRSAVAPELVKAGAFQRLPVPAALPPQLPLLPDLSFGVDLVDLAHVAGSPAAALFLVRALEWQRRVASAHGEYWFKSQAEWEAETGLSRHEQETARLRLKRLGVLHEARRGLPSRLWFRVDEEKVIALLREWKAAASTAGGRVWH
jgi:prophage antirepressor-like protein